MLASAQTIESGDITSHSLVLAVGHGCARQVVAWLDHSHGPVALHLHHLHLLLLRRQVRPHLAQKLLLLTLSHARLVLRWILAIA